MRYENGYKTCVVTLIILIGFIFPIRLGEYKDIQRIINKIQAVN